MKSITKSSLFITIIASLLISTGFGCKGLSSSEQQAVQPVKLEIWTVFEDSTALQGVVAKWTAARPFMNVNIRQFKAEELYPKLVEALAEDKGPDIISVKNRWIDMFLTKISPMPATVKDTTEAIIKKQFSTDIIVNTKNITLPTVEQIGNEFVGSVKTDAVRMGKVYGLPISFDTMAIYYNKDLLDRAGIPEPPKNWTEFQDAVKKLAKVDRKNDRILQAGAALGLGENVPGADDLLYILMKQRGVNFTDKNYRASFQIPPKDANSQSEVPADNVMNFISDFSNPNSEVYTWNSKMPNALDAFVNGTLAIFFGYNYHNTIIKGRAPQLNYEILPMWQLSRATDEVVPPVNSANYWLFTVTEKSKFQNEAWALINYLTRSSANKEYLDTTSRPTALRAHIVAQSDNSALKPFASQSLTAENWYHGRNYETAVKAVNDMLKDWLEPSPDPDQSRDWHQTILNRGAQRINQTL